MDAPIRRSTNYEQSEQDELEETLHIAKVVSTFRTYKEDSKHRIEQKLAYLTSLPKDHQEKLIRYRESLLFQLKCVEINDQVMSRIADDVNIFENENFEHADPNGDLRANFQKPTHPDHEKTHSILKQIVREWSSEGECERNDCFQPILTEIENLFAGYQPAEVHILVPGAGLGRLPFEIARRGYTCQGNEYSLFMLFASNFILNKCSAPNAMTIYPWVHQSVNNLQLDAQLRGIRFPDLSPQSMPADVDFSMVAGNFTEIYSDLNRWNCICTCFFLDTGRNPLAYVEKIWEILRPGGFWINVGPLLYHYADLPNECSIEPRCFQIH